MAYSYSNIYKLPTTALRFFTVYGPWGRPDMALFKFTKGILSNKKIDIYNNGKMYRDFTYIDDVVDAVIKCAFKVATPNIPKRDELENPSHSYSQHRIFNIGNNKPTELEYFISLIEKNLNKKAIKNYLDMQPGDVESTFANTKDLQDWINFKPSTSIDIGIKNFIGWYLSYYKNS